jgi:uncharacterized protein YuzE
MNRKLPKVVYDKENDSLYMIISKGRQEGYIELAPNVNLEIGSDGKIIGLEILQATRILKSAKKPMQLLQ